MQTDPNWTNFLWNSRTHQVGGHHEKRCPSHHLQIELVDFGATREYSKEFMDNWARLLGAAAADDRQGCVEWSLKLGYLTGEENEVRGRLLFGLGCVVPFFLTGPAGDVGCTRAIDDAARYAVQARDASTVCVRSRL